MDVLLNLWRTDMDLIAVAVIVLFNLAIGAPALADSKKPAVAKKPAVVQQVQQPAPTSPARAAQEEIVER